MRDAQTSAVVRSIAFELAVEGTAHRSTGAGARRRVFLVRMDRAFVPSSKDVTALLRLAVPIAAMQVGMILMGVVDTIFVGHVSARELAAAALGGLYTIGLFNFCLGVVWAVDPLVSQALGARDHEAAALGVQ